MVEKNTQRTVAAGVFKAKCLRIMDEVAATRRPVTVTKNGRPIAKLVPIDDDEVSVFGCLAGEITIAGDILEPIAPHTSWKALR